MEKYKSFVFMRHQYETQQPADTLIQRYACQILIAAGHQDLQDNEMIK